MKPEEQMPEAEMNIPYSPNYPSMTTMQMPSEKADLIDKINPETIIEVIKHGFMGEELINGKWTKIPELQDRALTMKGACELSNLMRPASSQNVSISKVDERAIRIRTQQILEAAMFMCLRNFREYGIKGSDQIYMIKEIIVTNTYMTLMQPVGGSIQKVITGTMHEQRMVQDESKKPSLLGGLIRR